MMSRLLRKPFFPAWFPGLPSRAPNLRHRNLRPLDAAMTHPFVTIIMPTLNEERYIERALRTVMPKSQNFDFEILVLDGGSTDRTMEIVVALGDPRIRLHKNPGKLQSAAINLGAQLADPRSDVLIRADSHAAYPPGFAAVLLESIH